MDLLDDRLYEPDERGLNGFDRLALDFVVEFLEKLQRNARIYQLDGNDVMLLNQAKEVVMDFLKVDYDGYVRITSYREDGLGRRSSDLEITVDKILIGVSGKDVLELGGDPYSDPYFIVGSGDENVSLDDDLATWEEEFFDKLTHPGAKVTVEGEIQNVSERSFSDEEDPDPWDDFS